MREREVLFCRDDFKVMCRKTLEKRREVYVWSATECETVSIEMKELLGSEQYSEAS